MKPKRIQLRRTKGWRLPANTVVVSRPTRWGNPFAVGQVSDWGDVPDHEIAVVFFRSWLCIDAKGQKMHADAVRELRGKNLACWCALSDECHADALLELANGVTARPNADFRHPPQ